MYLKEELAKKINIRLNKSQEQFSGSNITIK